MKKVINFILLISLLSLIGIWLFAEVPLFSPFSSDLKSSKHQQVPKKIYGFLPFWNLEEVRIQKELTDLAYFSLTINEDGTLKTKDEENLDPGFSKLSSDRFDEIQKQMIDQDKKIHIVLSLFENKKIENFLNSEQAQNNFYQSIDSLLLAYPFDGLNIDIEYTGEATQELRNKYSEFIKETSKHLKTKYKNKIEFSIDVYAAASTKKMIWDINQIHEEIDYIVVMAYDFHRSSSSQAGPVAPLFTKENSWKESIHSYLSDFAKKVPTQKILLGIPFYGYEWQTTTREAQAFTYPKTGSTASYKRVKEILSRKEELQLQEHWDENALAPYLTYVENENFYTIYYENEKSIKYKLEYVKQLNLGGIAIWSLGYEGNSREMWDVIQQSLLLEQATNSKDQ